MRLQHGLYFLLACIATSIFFSVLALLNSLDISAYYYHAIVVETEFLSPQLDLYLLASSTFAVLVGLTVLTLGQETRRLERLPILLLIAGLVLLTVGSTALAAILILVGQMTTLKSLPSLKLFMPVTG